jgi:hypothetical protein
VKNFSPLLTTILCAGYFYAFPVRETISIEKHVPPVSYSPMGIHR